MKRKKEKILGATVKNFKYSSKKRKGILFLKNLSPNIVIQKMVKFFDRFGILGRMYFVKYNTNKNQSNLKTNAIGWIEYLDKKSARQAYIFLKKYNFIHKYLPEVTVKYLKSFKWDELLYLFI